MSSVNFSHLLPPTFKEKVKEWIIEDVPSFDFGASVVGDSFQEACLYGKSNLVLAGVPFVDEIVKYFELKIEWKVKERDFIKGENSKVVVAVVSGPAYKLLQAERLILNMLIRCCSIATLSKSYRDLANESNWKGVIAGTRKTTPGFRIIEKYALLVGGCATHRYDVSSMCMLKDNHIDVNGGITNAVNKAKLVCGFTTMIEVECRTEEDAFEACKAGAHIIMLDNFDPESCKKSAEKIKKQYPNVTIEASGGITLKTVSGYLSPHVDVISFGALTQGYPTVDMSLKIQK